ncbi:chaperonin 10-like protein [Pilaira anomala]|nr:chaperonin 10-like protein [Pilaira anomala]
MSIVINQFASTDRCGEFKSISTTIKALSYHEILIKILACGVCYVDCSYMGRNGDVLGHEPVGRVVKKGSSVERLNVGDIVGTSFLKFVCLDCRECNMNAFADHQVCDSRFEYKIPEGMKPKFAGPLFCSGVAVFNALYYSKVPPTDRVAVIGIGQLTIQFCHAWGVHCTKQEEIGFVVHDFLASKDLTPEYIDTLKKYDIIINTVSTSLVDWDLYLALLKPDQKSIKGSHVGGRYAIELMLEFAKRHNIKPTIEEYPLDLDGLHAAIACSEKNQAWY